MKGIRNIFFLIFITAIYSCKKDPLVAKYNEIVGLWTLESAILNEKAYKNDSLLKYDINIPKCKVTKKILKNESTRCLLYFESNTSKLFQGYKVKENNVLDFGSFGSDYGGSNTNEISSKVFIGEWQYSLVDNKLILIRNINRPDLLSGLKLVYRKK